ncbi:MAG: CBS domain-containing protein [Polyangiaceae bacterium]|nr:CBS domain-containing protein [Polyangiaceae bacterium]
MSESPHSIGTEQPLTVAHEMMRLYGIRHLPVLHGGRLVGVLTERDLALVETLPGVDKRRVTVDDAMTPDPYVVAPDVPLGVVIATMRDRKLGSAIVAQGARVVGVFTTVDALAALADALAPAREGAPAA